jgi:rRNA maturation endonuclease Nob1
MLPKSEGLKLDEVSDHLESVRPGDIAMAKTMNYVGVALRILKEALIEFELVCPYCDVINFDPMESKGSCLACGAPLGRARPLEWPDGK